MSGRVAAGKARLPQTMNVGDVKEIPLSTTTSAVLVEIVAGGGGLLPFGSWKGSGTLSADGGGAATFGYLADVANSIASAPVEYVRNVSTANVKLSVFITSNAFAATALTITAYKNGAPTLLTIPVPAGTVGYLTASGVFPYLDTDTWDLRIDNPGGEVNAAISLGYGVDFY